MVLAIWYSNYRTTPHQITTRDTAQTSFATMRALTHVQNMTKAPHYTGGKGHQDTQNYIIQTLQALGLKPTLQKGYAISKTGTLSQPQNIIATIPGTAKGKGLLLMAHYDSHPHAAYGASDNASGVATILEGVRAYLARGHTPKNAIHILFTDGEELGLHGATLFVNEHPLAKTIGLALNFEARGSGGPSFMLVETQGGNSTLVQEFLKAKAPYPVANSLAYSVYKRMPNDTDLTVFRDQAGIDGFNFAFIDDHFDYHTASDTWERLDLNTLQHQGSYLMALLDYFSSGDLSALKSSKDVIYFDIPVFDMMSYPFSWIYPILWAAVVLFIVIIWYGIKSDRLSWRALGIGFAPALLSLGLSGGLTFLGWNMLTYCYPHYQEILQGFPYNGHSYILAFALLSIGISFQVYARFRNPKQQLDLTVAPLFLWLLIAMATALYLPGASYFVVLLFCGILSLFVGIQQQRPHPYLLVVLVLPSLFIITPFIKDFPIALGLKLLFLSALLTTFLFLLALPVVGRYRRKKTLGYLFMFAALGFLIHAHVHAAFDNDQKKPNSLLYVLEPDKKEAFWVTYDHMLDPWTRNYIRASKNGETALQSTSFYSKYGTGFTQTTKAPLQHIPAPRIEISKDTIIGASRQLSLCIAPQRDTFNFEALSANGMSAKDFVYTNGNTYNAFTQRWDDRLLTYYATANTPLELHMQFNKEHIPEMTLYESSFDLLDNAAFTIPQRSPMMMPKPFVLNDAVVVKKTIHFEE